MIRHPAVGGVRPQRAPLAVEAHLVGQRVGAREADPVVDPVRVALAEGGELDAATPRAPGCASRPGHAAKADGLGVGRAVARRAA